MQTYLSVEETPSMSEVKLVLDLADLDGSMLALVGGKAANLGELIRAGLPAP